MISVVVWIALAIVAVDGCPKCSRVVAAVLSWQATRVPAGLQDRVEREVTAIWRRLGIDVQWRSARAGELGVTVIVKDTGANAGSFSPLGWVQFAGNEPAAVLYASADAVWNSVQAGRTDTFRLADEPLHLQDVLAGRLLGRAIAHELGHYLLGSRAHTRRGLMRPTLDPVDGLTRRAEWYDLDSDQRRALQQRMAVLTLRARAAEAGAVGS